MKTSIHRSAATTNAARRHGRSLAWAAIFGFACLASTGHAEDSVFATGLVGPIKLDVSEGGSLVVSERGNGANDGQLSVVDRHGNVRLLLGGLPSGIEVTGVPSGPTSVVVRGCCSLDLAVGEGDTLRFPDPMEGPKQLPNLQGAASPLFSSVLRIAVNRPLDEIGGGWTLSREDHDVLADGFTVRLTNPAAESVWVRLIADLKDFRPDSFTNVRGSNPFGMARGKHPESLLIADGGQNSLVELTPFFVPKTLVRFAPVPNPPEVGFPTDAVPTSVRPWHGGRVLMTLFGGVPFAAGTSSVRIVDLEERTQEMLIGGLTSASDVLSIGSKLYVLELSANLMGGAPGRLLRFATPTGSGQEIVGGLIGPSGMVYSPRHRAIFIAELFAGQIRRVPL
jgi:hypothetical protein